MNATAAVDTLTKEASSARALAKLLIARAAKGSKTDSGASSGTVYLACETTYRTIARCRGVSGAKALLSRALAGTNKTHPLLRNIRLDVPVETPRETLTRASGAKGSAPSAEGLETLLEMMITLLARFVGMDMVVQLVADSATVGTMEHQDPQ
ncbi:MAG: hypothetical protein H0U66_07460 [Gemmatimonadaceae bacterium]|nr:hypothetical protein [Gemmatimonadaceae bacterium]